MPELKCLSSNDPDLKQMLWTGRLQTDAGEKLAILKSIRLDGNKEFVFELRNSYALMRPTWFKCLLITVRVFSLTAVITPGLAVLGAGLIFEGRHANLFLFFTSLFSVMCLQIAVNVFNDVQDHLKGVDLPGDIGGSGVIQKGWLSAKEVSTIGKVSLALAVGLASFPLLAYPKELLGIGLCALFGGIGYSGFGLGLKYRALGDLAVLLLCGPLLTIGFSIAAFGTLSISTVLIGVNFGLAAVAILHANNLNDLEIDADRGARTIANQIGFKWSQKYLVFIYGAIFLSCALSAAFVRKDAILFLAPLLVSPLVIRMLQKVNNATGPLSPAIAKIRFEAAQIHLMIGASVMLALLIKMSFNA